jgi:hypothetical protein
VGVDDSIQPINVSSTKELSELVDAAFQWLAVASAVPSGKVPFTDKLNDR